MRWHLTTLCLLVTVLFSPANTSYAADVSVRSGLHDSVPRIVFLGGRNVERSRYPFLIVDFLETRPPGGAVASTKIAAEGCSAELGAYRLRNDVLPCKPTLIVLDFSGEDHDVTPAAVSAAVEGIVRQTWRADPTTDLLIVDETAALEAVAEHYGIPSLNLAASTSRPATVPLPTTGPTTASDPISDAIISAWPQLTAKSVAKHALPPAMNRTCLENVSIAAPAQLPQGWSEIESKDTPDYDVYRRLMPRMWQAEPGALPLESKFTGKKISLQVLATAGSGRLSVEIDYGKPVSVRVDDPNEPTPHGRILVIGDRLAAGEHRLKISTVGAPVTIGQFLFVGE